jgi:hypothetical protein
MFFLGLFLVNLVIATVVWYGIEAAVYYFGKEENE